MLVMAMGAPFQVFGEGWLSLGQVPALAAGVCQVRAKSKGMTTNFAQRVKASPAPGG